MQDYGWICNHKTESVIQLYPVAEVAVIVAKAL
jgi:hypothetical protein